MVCIPSQFMMSIHDYVSDRDILIAGWWENLKFISLVKNLREPVRSV